MLGKQFYDRYRAAKGGLSVGGVIMPTWDELPVRMQGGFEAAAQVIPVHDGAEDLAQKCYNAFWKVLHTAPPPRPPTVIPKPLPWDRILDQFAWRRATEVR